MSEIGIVTRGNLPHWYVPGAAHFVTYRLIDTLPFEVLCRLRAERDAEINRPPLDGMSAGEHRSRQHKRFFAAYDKYLGRNQRVRWLQNPDVAQIVVDNLYHHHGSKYQLLEYTVMPNHVHVLLMPLDGSYFADAGSIGNGTVEDPASVGEYMFSDEIADVGSPLSKIMHSLKSYTANEANRILGRKGRFWQAESYDHWVRFEREISGIAEYIAANAVTAKLVENAWDWPWCSAHDRKYPRAKRLAEWW